MSIDLSSGHPEMNYPQHDETYRRFLRYTRNSIIFLVLLLAAMKYFLV